MKQGSFQSTCGKQRPTSSHLPLVASKIPLSTCWTPFLFMRHTESNWPHAFWSHWGLLIKWCPDVLPSPLTVADLPGLPSQFCSWGGAVFPDDGMPCNISSPRTTNGWYTRPNNCCRAPTHHSLSPGVIALGPQFTSVLLWVFVTALVLSKVTSPGVCGGVLTLATVSLSSSALIFEADQLHLSVGP